MTMFVGDAATSVEANAMRHHVRWVLRACAVDA